MLQLNGQYLAAELWKELEALQDIEHKNLTRFLRFFERKDDSLIVLEYVSNGSLREHLDGMLVSHHHAFCCSIPTM